MLTVSHYNYPGAKALITLHESQGYSQYFKSFMNTNDDFDNSSISVHIDVLPAMSGISRFLELEHPWSYSKVIKLNN